MALFFSLCENYLVLLLRMSVPHHSHVRIYYMYHINCSKHFLLLSYIGIIALFFNVQEVRI